MKQRVDDFLTASANAQRVAGLDLGGGRQIAIWQNSQDEVRYDSTTGHAFSFYLKGGQGSRRVDGKVRAGWPGALCVLPEGHSSEWQITAPFQFVHLYVPDDALRAAYARTHDRDSRLLDMSERTFATSEGIGLALQALAGAATTEDVLAADEGFAELVARLPDRKVGLAGGLSPKVLRNVDDWIGAHQADGIRLKDLAQLAGLSEFHFHRMFRLSRGMAPHRWVMMCRVLRAKSLLPEMPVAQVAAECGFSSQSHLTRSFKGQMGMTPGQYRRAMTAL